MPDNLLARLALRPDEAEAFRPQQPPDYRGVTMDDYARGAGNGLLALGRALLPPTPNEYMWGMAGYREPPPGTETAMFDDGVRQRSLGGEWVPMERSGLAQIGALLAPFGGGPAPRGALASGVGVPAKIEVMAAKQRTSIAEPVFSQGIDPKTLRFREAQQNRLSDVEHSFPPGEGYPPLVTVRSSEGAVEILDGHNRAAVAIRRGDHVPTVEINQATYDALKQAGLDDIEIAHHVLERAGQGEAASMIRQQFRGSDILRSEETAHRVWDGE